MPIRKELRHLYTGPEWKRTRAQILKRAGNRCEFCGRPNRKLVLVTLGGEWWDEAAGCWRDKHGQPCEPAIKGLARRVRVILQCAHLNHSRPFASGGPLWPLPSEFRSRLSCRRAQGAEGSRASAAGGRLSSALT